MITEIYTPVDKECEKSLKEIERVFSSEVFLAGLGKSSQEMKIPKEYNVLTEYERCNYLLTSQLMWDKPRKNNGDQNFAEIVDDAVDYLGNNTYEREEAKRRKGYFFIMPKLDATDEYFKEVISNSYKNNDTIEFLQSQFQKVDSDTVKLFKGSVTQSTQYCLNIFIRSAFFGGFKKWPVSKYILQCYSTGGFPTGWVGPLHRNGGKAKDCMQMLHFGKQ